MAYRTFDERQTMRDLLVAWRCYPDRKPINILRELKRARGERRV